MAHRCNLIIDSCCDLPADLVAGSGIELLRFPYLIGTREHLDDLFVETTPHDFYESMRLGNLPMTAQIPILAMTETFTRALESGVPTVYLSFSSGLTGTFDTALTIAETLRPDYPNGKLILVDTKLASIAEGLLVYEAIRQRDRGLNAEELADWAREAINYIHGVFIVDDLMSLSRGGRLPSTIASVGSKLDVKPILTFSDTGKLTMMSMAHGRKKGMKQLVESYSSQKGEQMRGTYVLVAGADCDKDVKKLLEMLYKVDATMPIVEAHIGPVIGSHVGPGMLAMAFWGCDRRDDMSIADQIANKVKRER